MSALKTALLGAAACFVFAAPALAMDVAADKAAVDKVLDAEYPHLDAVYKDIHAHPELGHQEVRTAALLAKEMRALGFEVTEHVGGTGVVAIYHNGPGPTVMVRTELDALPMEEKTGLPYASHVETEYEGKRTFVAHSCGHDIHMAVWLGAARALLDNKSKWHGTLMFIGQPAEESVDGAAGMIRDGLFTRFPKPDVGYALHSTGAAPYGVVNYKSGVISSTSDSLEITFHGRGSHGARPHLSIDPIVMGAKFVVDVQSVISREKDPQQSGVITIGAFHGGSAGNIIPDTVELRGTVRSFDEGVRKKLQDGITRTATAEAMMAGAPAPEVKFTGGAASVVNDAALTAQGAEVLKRAFGDKAIAQDAPGAASEDYSAFIAAGVPSFFFLIGVYDPAKFADAMAKGQPLPSNHSPYYAPVPEPTIRTGVEAMTLVVMNRMSGG
jgi:hippurate hydrolase